MERHHKRGLRRLVVVIVVVWAAAWATVYLADRQSAADLAWQLSLARAAADLYPPPTKQSGNYVVRLEEKERIANERALSAIGWGVGGVAGFPIMTLAAIWVWRGFRSVPFETETPR